MHGVYVAILNGVKQLLYKHTTFTHFYFSYFVQCLISYSYNENLKIVQCDILELNSRGIYTLVQVVLTLNRITGLY